MFADVAAIDKFSQANTHQSVVLQILPLPLLTVPCFYAFLKGKISKYL